MITLSLSYCLWFPLAFLGSLIIWISQIILCFFYFYFFIFKGLLFIYIDKTGLLTFSVFVTYFLRCDCVHSSSKEFGTQWEGFAREGLLLVSEI